MSTAAQYVSPMRPIFERAKNLTMDESFDLMDFPCDEYNRIKLGTYLRSNGMLKRFKIRSLVPKGVRVICVGTYGSTFRGVEETFTEVYYPVLKHKEAAPCNGLRPGGFFLGFMSYSSLHVNDIPKQARCDIKACPFPAYNGIRCREHIKAMSMSFCLLGVGIDNEMIYGSEDKPDPLLYSGFAFELTRENFIFEYKGQRRHDLWHGHISHRAGLGRPPASGKRGGSEWQERSHFVIAHKGVRKHESIDFAKDRTSDWETYNPPKNTYDRKRLKLGRVRDH